MDDGDLVAAIEASPDDVEAFYVYGDWLQQSGDPRGELVALQAAQHRDPGDKKLAQRADRYLRSHEAALLPEGLAGVTLVWRNGFIRDAEFSIDGGRLLPSLRALLQHPSGRFIRSIGISVGRIDVDGLIALLLELRRPRTLADLRIVGGLAEETTAELQKVFPRLDRSIDVVWRAIAAAVAKERRVDIRFDAESLPALVPIGTAPELPIEKLLVALRVELDKGRPLGVITAMRRTFTPRSLDEFAVALASEYLAHGQQTTMRWGFAMLGKLGGELATKWIGDRLAGWGHHRAVHGAELLVEIGTPGALFEVYSLACDNRIAAGRRGDAWRALDGVARARGVDVERLIDRSVPATLGARAKVAAARRLLDIMLAGRRFDARELVRYIITHPALGPLAERLVWASFDGVRVTQTFRSTGERLVDSEGQAVAIERARIGIVHPAELDAARRASVIGEWRDVFEALEIEPLFPQLDRPVHVLRDDERGTTLRRFASRVVGFEALRSTLVYQRGWTPPIYGDGTGLWEKLFPRDGVEALATMENGAVVEVTLRNTDRDIVPLEQLHPVTLSELLDDLETVTRRAPEREQPEAPPPETELAKGTRVRITSGSAKGVEGVVFWIGVKSGGTRVGLRANDGTTHWAALASVSAEGVSQEREPIGGAVVAYMDLPKGTRVEWRRGKRSGRGTVFWVGTNKFGGGARVGVRDDETGETVWADAGECTPIQD